MPTCSGSVCGTGGWTGPQPGDPSDAATLTATPEFGGIELAWSEPAVNPFAVAYTKIYRSSTADFANAITLPASGGSTYFDRMEDGLTFWYWIRFVSINGTEGELVGPASATSGSMVQDLLDKLLGNLTDNQLSNELRTEIGRIELLNGQIGQEIAERQAALDLVQANLDAMQDEIAASSALLLQEVNQRAVSVNTEISDRIAAINGLRTEVAGNALTLETDLTTAFQAADAATLASANSFTYSRATIDAADAATLDTLRTELTAGLGATLTSAQSYVQGYTYSFSGVDSAIADIATVLRSEFQTADSNAAAYLSTNHYTKAEADSAMASSTNTLRSQLTGGYAGTDLNQVMSGLLYIERTTRASEDQALSQQISLLSAGSNDQFDYSNIWYFDSGAESWVAFPAGTTASSVAGWLRLVSDAGSVANPSVYSPDNLNVNAAQYTQVRSRIRKVGNPTWEGRMFFITVADTTYNLTKSVQLPEPAFDGNGISLITFNAPTSWTGTIRRIRLDLSDPVTTTDYFEIDWVAIGRPSPGASSADLLLEQQARIDGDTAEVLSRETLSTIVTGQADPTGLTVPTLSSGLLYDERQLRSAADQTEITARQALSTKVTGAADPSGLTLGTLSSGLLYDERQLRATADSNEITARQALSTKVTGAADPASLTLASLSSGLLYEERQARSTADASEVTARQDLSTKVTGAANPASLTLATLSSGLLYDERQARSTADSTEVSARQALSAKITGANDPASLTLATLSAGLLYDERQARVTADNSQVSRLDALEATVNNGTTGVAATAAALDTVELLVNNGTTGVTATANKVSTLQARIDASPNLWPNAEFIAGAGAWSDAAMFDRAASGVPAAAPSSRVLRTTASSVTSSSSMPAFVTAGQVLETEVWVHSDVAQNWQVYYTATDDAGVSYSSGAWQLLTPSIAVPANTWTKLKGEATIPVGATKLRVVLDPKAGSGAHVSHVAKPSIREKTASMASIEETSTTTVTDLNNVKSQWTMKVQARTDTKQVMAGIGLAATAAGSVGQSEMIFMADKFAWVPPGNINAAPNGLLQAGLVNGVSTWVFPSTMLGDQSVGARVVIDGTLEARHIKANELKADNALTRGLTVRDDAGNVILSSGNALDFSRVGGSTRPADNATVGATVGTNLVGLGDSTNLWNDELFEHPGWPGSSWTVGAPTDIANMPARVIRYSASGNAGAGTTFVASRILSDLKVPFVGGETLVLKARFWAQAGATGTVGVYVICYDGSGNQLSTYAIPVDCSTFAGGTYDLESTYTVPAAARYIAQGFRRGSVANAGPYSGVVEVGGYKATLQPLWARVGGSGKPENNATVGAQAGVNLLDGSGASVSDLAFLNKFSNGDQLAGDLSGNPFMTKVDVAYDRPLGIKAGYQTSAPTVVKYADSARSVASIGANGDTTVGVVWPAFRVQQNMRYRAFVRWRIVGGTAGAVGVFMRFLGKTTEIAQGCTHIGFSSGESGVDLGGTASGSSATIISDTNTNLTSGFYENRTLSAANTWYETVVEYNPGSNLWASFCFLKWTGQPDTSRLEIDSCFIYAVSSAADGATVGATFGVNINGQITSVNVSTYIAAAAIGWAQIGSLDINANGYIRSGKTAWGSGNGWYLGRDAGEASLDIGDTNAYLRYKPSTGLQIKLPTGVTGTVTGFADAHNTSTSSTAEATSSGSITGVTGGLSPYIYDWSLNVIETWGGTSREIKFNPSGSLASVSIKGANTAAQVGVQCRIIDSNGRVAVLGKIITIRTGTATATPP